MAIDTANKRLRAPATRRLPWFRRFIPHPDGTIGIVDRWQLGFVYYVIGETPSRFFPAVGQENAPIYAIGPTPDSITCRQSAIGYILTPGTYNAFTEVSQ